MLVFQTLEIIIGTICGTVLAQNTAKLVGTKSLVGLKALLTKGCGRGEIGKHKGLKIPRLNGLAGSSPAARTTLSGPLKLTLWNSYVLHKACASNF